MSGPNLQTPDLLPVLSTGRHRSPRKGACFMEMASFLAGERWSDHPKCTHPLLASIARLVNDNVPDDVRPALAPMIPSVIGLTGEDPRIDATLALRCATAALPIASATRQNVLAVGLLSCERLLADLDGRSEDDLRESSREALDAVPEAERWARQFSRGLRASRRAFQKQTAPHVVTLAVQGIAVACVADQHARLVRLLDDCIADTAALVRPSTTSAPSQPYAAPPPVPEAAGGWMTSWRRPARS